MHGQDTSKIGLMSNDLGSACKARPGRNYGDRCFRERPVLVFAAISLLAFFYLLSSVSAIWSASSSFAIDSLAKHGPPELVKYALTAATPLLEVLQVYPPVLTVGPNGTVEISDGYNNTALQLGIDQQPQCFQSLVVHSFAYSYGQPYIGSYEPPSCEFNHVTWNLSVTSAGRQFDRLGIVYLGDVEVFRTSTAEPTTTGIEWVYLKDMTPYLALFRSSQKLIFDLGNLIDNTYTGAFNVTLTATYFTTSGPSDAADIILPVSTRQSSADAASVFMVPDQNATNSLTFPQNALRAVFTVAAAGQSTEEFWWSNVPTSNMETFPQTGTFYGGSPFREVQLYIDEVLAGVAWPFPIIFTGGVVPGLWRPIVGIDAFDLREDEIDITPFLPILCDGRSHTFTIRVSGLSTGGNGSAVLSETTGEHWYVTGKAFIWLDLANHTTTGTIIVQNAPVPQFGMTSSVGTTPNGTNETLDYQVTAHRQLSFLSVISTSQGQRNVSWQQSLFFSNIGSLVDAGNVQINQQSTTGMDVSSSGYAKRFDYPLWAKSAYSTFRDNYTISAEIQRGKVLQTYGQAVFPTGLESFYSLGLPVFDGVSLSTTQNGSATYIANGTSSTSFSFGTTQQDMDLTGLKSGHSTTGSGFPGIRDGTELHHRYISAVNGSVVEDDVRLVGTEVPQVHTNLDLDGGFAAPGVRAMLGRGPKGIGQN